MPDCLGPFTFESDKVETQIIDLSIVKTTCPYALKWHDICYMIIISNNSEIDMFGLLFSDKLADNMEYIIGSFTVADKPQTPMMAENTIQYPVDILANSTIEIKFCVKVIY